LIDYINPFLKFETKSLEANKLDKDLLFVWVLIHKSNECLLSYLLWFGGIPPHCHIELDHGRSNPVQQLLLL